MDKQKAWKRTEDFEIDLTDLLRSLCMKWKQMAVCALAAAVLFGGYGCYKSRNDAEQGMDMQTETQLTEEDEQSVADAVELERRISELEAYMDHSVLMETDPYHKNKAVLLYSISHAKRRELQEITESYLSFLLYGGVVETLQGQESDICKMDKSCLAELITAWQKTHGSSYQISVDSVLEDDMEAETLFYVEVTGKDSEMAGRLADGVADALEQYRSKAESAAGKHTLKLLNRCQSETADSSLNTWQREKKMQLALDKASLKTMTEAFQEEQKAAYEKRIGTKGSQKASGQVPQPESTGVLYAFLGLLAGIFVSGGLYTCRYLLCDTVKSVEEMKRLYTFPVYGGISLRGTYECQTAVLLKRLRLACDRQGIRQLCLAADFSLKPPEQEYMEGIVKQLEEWGIDAWTAEHAYENLEMWEKMAQTQNVLVICRIGATTHRMLDHAMEFYAENGIAVTGAAAFY